MTNHARRLLAVVLSLAACRGGGEISAQRAAVAVDTTFAATVARISEPAGFFDTDNLISNESSYLHVLGRLRTLGVTGGAYVGVGPDQNYSYIAAIRPSIAFIVDVRRDNALQHLMFKGLFARSGNRLEYLCRWLGRPVPADVAAWGDRPLADILAYLDRTPPDPAFAAAEQRAVLAEAVRSGVALSAKDHETIARFHGEFIREGLELRFTSFNRPPRPYYPTLRQLILERDMDGRPGSYLVREADFLFLKELHARGRIIPVVGNLAGNGALPALAEELAVRGTRLSALYTSNVEFYLWGDDTFDTYARNVARLPREPHAVIIRSWFGRQFGDQHPLAVPGYASAQLLQPVDDFVRRHGAGGWRSYRELVTRGAR